MRSGRVHTPGPVVPKHTSSRQPQRLQRLCAQVQPPVHNAAVSTTTDEDGTRMLTLSAPRDRVNGAAAEPATRHSPSSNGSGVDASNQGPTPTSNGSSQLTLSRRVPAGSLIRTAAAEAASVLQARREGVLVGATDITANDGFDWANSSYDRRSRGIRIWLYAIDLRVSLTLLDKKWTYLLGGYSDDARSARARLLAVRLRSTILQLGPTFIKIGQLFSSRSDVLGTEFVQELSKLQDRVPAFSAAKTLATLEQQLGAPATTLFKEFNVEPLAAASLGQVHRAVLWDGRTVAVKVQRPGLKALFDIDLAALRQIAAALDAQDETRDFVSIYDECADVLYQEIDYLQEGRNAARFRRNFAAVPWVRVPVVEWSLTAPMVLTMEFMPGTKISDVAALRAAGIDTKLTAGRATEAYLTQILKHGFFHADPHPGNIAIDASGNLVFYDFGMMGEIKADVRENLLEVFYGVYDKDADRVLDALITLGVLRLKAGDRISLRRTISFFISNLSRQAERKETLENIGEDVFAIAVDQPFRFPATFTFVLRAFTTLEGVSKGLDPGYNFATEATPYARALLDLDGESSSGRQLAVAELQKSAAQLGSDTVALPSRVEYLQSTLRRMEDGDLKLRVRVLESERAARRQGVLQKAQLHSIGLFGFLNLGSNFALQGQAGPANVCLGLALVFGGMVTQAMRRVQRLDKFEKDING
eukprot:jgi/Ulvmu1/5048/UM021_0065.1